jgi:hypothetical protein
MPSDEGKRRPRDAGSVHPFTRVEERRMTVPDAAAQLTRWWQLVQPNEDGDEGVGCDGPEDQSA